MITTTTSTKKPNAPIQTNLPMTTKVTLNKSQLARLARIEKRIAPPRRQLREHKLYNAIEDAQDLRRFVEMHVFAIWDFMSLLKALEVQYTSVKSLPWIPAENGAIARLITEMVMRYECDANEKGEAMSHFEMYLQAMNELGADSKYITTFLNMLRSCFSGNCISGKDINNKSCSECVNNSLVFSGVPKGAADFVRSTFRLVDSSEHHRVAASLAFGRQYLIIDKLLAVLDKSKAEGKEYGKLRYILQRHKDLYDKNYTPLSFQVLVEICGDSDSKWKEVEESAIQALKARIALWDTTYDLVLFRKPIMEYECRVNNAEKMSGIKWQKMMYNINQISLVTNDVLMSSKVLPSPNVKQNVPEAAAQSVLKQSVPGVPDFAWKSVGLASSGNPLWNAVTTGSMSNPFVNMND